MQGCLSNIGKWKARRISRYPVSSARWFRRKEAVRHWNWSSGPEGHGCQVPLKLIALAMSRESNPNDYPQRILDASFHLTSLFPPRGPCHPQDPVRHLIGTAMAYGGNPEKDALYLNVTPSKNDGKTVHRLTINGEVSPSTASGRSLSTTTRAI
jgi:hypothetical protein